MYRANTYRTDDASKELKPVRKVVFVIVDEFVLEGTVGPLAIGFHLW